MGVAGIAARIPVAQTNSTSTNNIATTGAMTGAGSVLHRNIYAPSHHQQNNSTAHLVNSSSHVGANPGAPTEASSAVTRAQQRIN